MTIRISKKNDEAFEELFEQCWPYLAPTNYEAARDTIYRKYTEPHRFYHNVNHIGKFYRMAKVWKPRIICWPAFCLAILFHDYIYDVRNTDGSNEVMSARIAASWINNSSSLANAVAHMIVDLHPDPSLNYWFPGDHDLFHDLDHLILASDSKTYRKYVEAIYAEYLTEHSYEDVKRGRQKFLTNPDIARFRIDPISKEFGADAVINIFDEQMGNVV